MSNVLMVVDVPPRKRQRTEKAPDNVGSITGTDKGGNTSLPLGATQLPTGDKMHPQDFLKTIFASTVQGHDLLQLKRRSVFEKPTQEEIDAYDMQAVTAVRSGDITKLRVMARETGKSFNACNRFGESLFHMACRRGDVKVVRFLIREADVRLDIRDDYGRTPAHDACWTSKPNFDVMEELLQVLPLEMFLSQDVRGFTPFQYARREHWARWVEFLSERRPLLLNRLQALAKTSVCMEDNTPLKTTG